jgi:SAM-dependent methyltransferase
MPTSHPSLISPIMERVLELRPLSILELGIGYGKYGALLREYFPKALIIGVEGWAAYRNENWSKYDEVLIQDFVHVASGNYDLVLMVDSLEHLDKQTGGMLLKKLVGENRRVLVSTPDGEYPQGAVNGNEYERHRATWTATEFVALGGRVLANPKFDIGYGVLVEFEGRA